MTTVTAEVEIDFPDGKRSIEMLLKNSSEVQDSEKGSVVMFNLTNGEQIIGLFRGMSDEDALIGSLDGKHTLGYKPRWIENYFEEIKKQPVNTG